MTGTIIRRRVVGFVKTKGRKTAPLPRRTNVLPEDDRMVGAAASRAAPLLARPVPAAAGGKRYKVVLAALAVVGLAIAGLLMVRGAVNTDSASRTASRLETASAGVQRRAGNYGEYPGSRDGSGVVAESTPSTEESFLAASYVRGKPRQVASDGAGAAVGGPPAAAADKAARPTAACVIKMDGGGASTRDFSACLRQMDGK